MSVADEIKVHQDWTKDGYQFKVVDDQLWTPMYVGEAKPDLYSEPWGADRRRQMSDLGWKWDLNQRCWVHKDEN